MDRLFAIIIVTSLISTMTASLLFQRLMKINLPPQFVRSLDSFEQVQVNWNWNDVFDFIKSKHWHRENDLSCPHSESLFEHLINAAEISLNKAKSLGYSDKDCVKAYFAGLLHDIGKPAARKQYPKALSFKGHGIIGGALIENFYSESIESEFGLTKEDWGDISLVSDIHMCGYFPDQTHEIHHFCYQILSDNVKKLLVCVRCGDIGSMIPVSTYPSTQDELIQQAESTEEAFITKLYAEPDYVSFLKSNNLHNGILIQMCGTSSSGKSYLSNKLFDNLSHKNITARLISRDKYMVAFSLNRMNGDPIGDPSTDNFEITPDLYQKCIQYYNLSNKSYASSMNEAMKYDISKYLQQGYVVILDTLMTMYAGPVSSILQEDVVSNAFKVNIWLHRNNIITESESLNRLGMTLQKQLEVQDGSTSIMNPFREDLNWDKLVALTEKKELKDLSVNQGHLTLSCGRTGMKDHILEDFMNKLEIIYDINQKTLSRLPSLEETMDMTLSQLIAYLFEVGNELPSVISFFEMLAYRVSQPFRTNEYSDKVIGIKYIDGRNNIWRPKWAREARGRFFYIDTDSDGKVDVIPIKDSLQRGIEVLSRAHTDNGLIETQDVDASRISQLDNIQQHITTMFSYSSAEFHGVLSGKVDGSLVIVNYYSKNSKQYQIISELVENVGDEFTKIIYNYCKSDDLPIITVSTQGTLFLSTEMYDYFITSLQNSVIEFEYTTAIDTWSRICPIFVSKVLEFLNLNDFNSENSHMLNLCFEAYCKGRMTADNVLHSELAIGYDHNGFNFLGVMKNNSYIPHFSLKDVVFNQPVCFKFNCTKQVFDIMSDMDEVVYGKLSKSDFMLKYFPGKLDAVLHMEGWVLLTPYKLKGGSSHSDIELLTYPSNDDGVYYDYAKLKTNLYYKCHKVRDDNVNELLSLPRSCEEYYPIIARLRDFYLNSEVKLTQCITMIHDQLCQEIHVDSKFYAKLNDKAKIRVNQYMTALESISTTVTESSLDLDKQKMIILKMYLNNCETELYELIQAVNMEVWNINSEYLVDFMRVLLMKVEPWLKGSVVNGRYVKLVKLIESKDKVMDGLYGLLNK